MPVQERAATLGAGNLTQGSDEVRDPGGASVGGEQAPFQCLQSLLLEQTCRQMSPPPPPFSSTLGSMRAFLVRKEMVRVSQAPFRCCRVWQTGIGKAVGGALVRCPIGNSNGRWMSLMACHIACCNPLQTASKAGIMPVCGCTCMQKVSSSAGRSVRLVECKRREGGRGA